MPRPCSPACAASRPLTAPGWAASRSTMRKSTIAYTRCSTGRNKMLTTTSPSTICPTTPSSARGMFPSGISTPPSPSAKPTTAPTRRPIETPGLVASGRSAVSTLKMQMSPSSKMSSPPFHFNSKDSSKSRHNSNSLPTETTMALKYTEEPIVAFAKLPNASLKPKTYHTHGTLFNDTTKRNTRSNHFSAMSSIHALLETYWNTALKMQLQACHPLKLCRKYFTMANTSEDSQSFAPRFKFPRTSWILPYWILEAMPTLKDTMQTLGMALAQIIVLMRASLRRTSFMDRQRPALLHHLVRRQQDLFLHRYKLYYHLERIIVRASRQNQNFCRKVVQHQG
mmetsp:Transcript_10499/g.14717  ORF Transcript_10499/g.14717 Transcript_10499/m.14717 type:complete len:339 (+) Transcript_10499:765-1781(+)